jgi:hypothetical protein
MSQTDIFPDMIAFPSKEHPSSPINVPPTSNPDITFEQTLDSPAILILPPLSTLVVADRIVPHTPTPVTDTNED